MYLTSDLISGATSRDLQWDRGVAKKKDRLLFKDTMFLKFYHQHVTVALFENHLNYSPRKEAAWMFVVRGELYSYTL